MAFKMKAYNFEVSKSVQSALVAAAEKVLRSKPEILLKLDMGKPVAEQMFIDLDFEKEGTVTAWLRRDGEYHGGYAVPMPGGMVGIQQFWNDPLGPGYDSDYGKSKHLLATPAEARKAVRESLAERRKFAEQILERAKALEELAAGFPEPEEDPGEEDW